jgi:CPA1 family monovalent cation:H+ antiporter
MREIVGGAALGLGAGWLATRLIRLVKDEGLDLMISLALVLGCYRLANLSDVSGPISVVTAGLCLGSLLPRPAPDAGTRSALIGFWGLLGQFLNTMLFLLIGLQILGLSMRPVELLQMTFAIPLAVISRMLSVTIPWGLTRDALRNKARDVAVLTWTGLRGGISVALALTLPASPWRADLLVVCYAVVVFTIVVQGLTMHRLLQAMYAEH